MELILRTLDAISSITSQYTCIFAFWCCHNIWGQANKVTHSINWKHYTPARMCLHFDISHETWNMGYHKLVN